MNKPKLAYLISSHFSYCTIALPRLLNSMKSAGISSESIFIVVCGCVREFDMKTNLGTFWYVNHESRNFCTFVEAVNPIRKEQLKDFTHVFCLMDTCEAGPKFGELTSNFDIKLNAVGANPFGPNKTQCDLGAYEIEHLKRCRFIINGYKNVKPEINLECEGQMFECAGPEVRGFYGWTGGYILIAGPEDIYGTGSKRITEYYPAIDLYKYKSNWGQNGKHVLEKL